MATKHKSDDYSDEEAEQRFKSALRGARLVGNTSAKIVTPKKTKGKLAKASPSSGASRASAKTGKP